MAELLTCEGCSDGIDEPACTHTDRLLCFWCSGSCNECQIEYADAIYDQREIDLWKGDDQ